MEKEESVDREVLRDQLNRRIIGTGAEIGGGIATDFATGGLLFAPFPGARPLYFAANAFQGSVSNYYAQKYINPDKDINWGEVISSGALSAIPFLNLKAGKNVAGIVGDANSLKRAVVGGAGMGVGGEQIRIGIDERRVLTPTEAVASAGVGAVTGGSLKALSNSLQQKTLTTSQQRLKEFRRLMNPNLINKTKQRLNKLGLIDADGNLMITELEKRELTKPRSYWTTITKGNIAKQVQKLGGTPEQAAAIYTQELSQWTKKKSAATYLNKLFTALTTELKEDGVKPRQLVIGEVKGKMKFVDKGSPNSYPYTFEVDHKRAVEELRTLGIDLGRGANFTDNLEVVLAVFNRQKNNLGNPTMPTRISEALGESTSLQEMVGKYFQRSLVKRIGYIPQYYKDVATQRMLGEILEEINLMGGQLKINDKAFLKIVDDVVSQEVEIWKSNPGLASFLKAWEGTFEPKDVTKYSQQRLTPVDILNDVIDSRSWDTLTKTKQNKFIRDAREYTAEIQRIEKKNAEKSAKSLKYYIDSYD